MLYEAFYAPRLQFYKNLFQPITKKRKKKKKSSSLVFLAIWEVLSPALDGWQKTPRKSPTSDLQDISFPKDFLSKGLMWETENGNEKETEMGALCWCHWGLLVFSTSLEFLHEIYHQPVETTQTGP